jgi:hypothetical protein
LSAVDWWLLLSALLFCIGVYGVLVRRNVILEVRLIDEDGLRGVTSNPAIFEKAVTGSTDYTSGNLSPPQGSWGWISTDWTERRNAGCLARARPPGSSTR